MSDDLIPCTRGWTALVVPLSTVKLLHVVGEIRLATTNEVPRLCLADPQSDDPAVLSLEVEISTRGPGALGPFWCAVGYSVPLHERLPTSVRITWAGIEVGRAAVVEE
ncbi:hypothetical protein [Methylobacterium oryzisoli]|uniref:hypothetical protein n=1 Tax=Methylobacterium oryzisoli TaxID=3385502 RepID=UPI0038918CBF